MINYCCKRLENHEADEFQIVLYVYQFNIVSYVNFQNIFIYFLMQ